MKEKKKERERRRWHILTLRGSLSFIHFLFSLFDGSMGRHFLPPGPFLPISLSLFFIFIDPVGVRIGDNGAVFYFAPTAQRGIIISSFFLLLCGCLGRTLFRERVKPLICLSRLSSKGTSPSSDYVTVAVF